MNTFNGEMIAKEIYKIAKDIMSSDRSFLYKAILEVMRSKYIELSVKIRLKVDFDPVWAGQYFPQTYDSPAEYPELSIEHEKYEIRPRSLVIPFRDIKRAVISELSGMRGRLETSPEELVSSRMFEQVLREVIMLKEFKILEDIWVDLPEGYEVSTWVDIKLSMMGSAVRVEASMPARRFDDLIEGVREKGEREDWFTPEW